MGILTLLQPLSYQDPTHLEKLKTQSLSLIFKHRLEFTNLDGDQNIVFIVQANGSWISLFAFQKQ